MTGGFSLAAQWCWGEDHDIVSFCEIEPFAQKVLNKHWPGVPIEPDIRKLNGKIYSGITLLTGGYPCQGFSVAGKRRGEEDDRYLWPEMFRIIKESKPTWVIGENVAGHVSLGLDKTIFDLESAGYSCQTVNIPACAVGAEHRRDRVWIIANIDSTRFHGATCTKFKSIPRQAKTPKRSEFSRTHAKRGLLRLSKPPICRTINGLSGKLDPDRKHRIKGLGNAIVPQVAYEIMTAIKAVEEMKP